MNDDLETATHSFGECDANQQSLFAVNSGIVLEDALINISQLLKYAGHTTYELSDCEMPQRGLLGATIHCIDSAKALADALLKGLASRNGAS